MAENNPHSFLRIIRSELEFGDDVDPHSNAVYARARKNLIAALERGFLFEDQDEVFYIYRVASDGHAQTGVVGCSAVDDYAEGRIKVHEKTRPDKVDDRVRHMVTLGSQSGPVFLTYRQSAGITELLDIETEKEPLYDFTAGDGVRHTVWKADNSADIAAAFKQVPASYVADGHHRAMSASVCREEIRESDPAYTRDHRCNYFLSVLFPHDELQILPYNRVVKSLPADTRSILSRIEGAFDIEHNASPEPDGANSFSMYMDGSWYGLSPKSNASVPGDPVGSLDVSILQNEVLGPIFGIGDPRTDENVQFVGGVRGTSELERLVESDAAAAAFSLHPVSIDQLLQVADEGLLMPPKSTWFEPKLRSGLFVHRFRD